MKFDFDGWPSSAAVIAVLIALIVLWVAVIVYSIKPIFVH